MRSLCVYVCVLKVCHVCLKSFRAPPWLWVVPLFAFGGELFFFPPQAIWCVFSGLIRGKQRGDIGVQQMIEMGVE